MNKVFGFIALAGFALSLLAHVSAILGIDVQSAVPAVWALHVGIFIVFIPMVVQFNSPDAKSDPMMILRGLPVGVAVFIVLLMVYVAINFLSSWGYGLEGSPSIHGQSFVLQKKGGQLVRVITEAEYHALRARDIRGFSGHWLLFYFVPFAHFLLRRKAIKDLRGS